ncbi:hypothetical protein EC973_004441 [Apophysomyces ossiformis]|uniref:Uncharacterized protein n=1 Tax=Apophysomyces ossiformis TaxID=679940 RepID=A0A8H7BV59_9FUNG|nr:hypothetical protein EC973_004441 [Apophysomyces ossiformis]
MSKAPIYYCSVLLPEQSNVRLLSPDEKLKKAALADRMARTEALLKKPKTQSLEESPIVTVPHGIHRIPTVHLPSRLQNGSRPDKQEKARPSCLNKANSGRPVSTMKRKVSFIKDEAPSIHVRINGGKVIQDDTVTMTSKKEKVKSIAPINTVATAVADETMPVSPLCPPPHLLRERRLSRSKSEKAKSGFATFGKAGGSEVVTRLRNQEEKDPFEKFSTQLLDRIQSNFSQVLISMTEAHQDAKKFWQEQKKDVPRDEELEMLRQQRIDLENEVNVSRLQLIGLQRQLVEMDLLKTRHAELEKDYESIQRQGAEMEQLRTELQRARLLVQELQETNAHLKDMVNIKDVDELVECKRKLDKEVERQSIENQRLQQQIAHLENEAARNQDEIGRLCSRNQLLETELEYHQLELERLQSRCESRPAKQQEDVDEGIMDCGEEFGRKKSMSWMDALEAKADDDVDTTVPVAEQLPSVPVEEQEEEEEEEEKEEDKSIWYTRYQDMALRYLQLRAGMQKSQLPKEDEDEEDLKTRLAALEEENKRIKLSESVNKIQMEYMQRELEKPKTLEAQMKQKDEELTKLRKTLDELHRRLKKRSTSSSSSYRGSIASSTRSPSSQTAAPQTPPSPAYEGIVTEDGHLMFTTQIDGQLTQYTVKLASHKKNTKKMLNPLAAPWQPLTKAN